jgi:hypothetical protein
MTERIDLRVETGGRGSDVERTFEEISWLN